MILNRFTFGVLCLVLAICLSGCSRKKDKFINRSYHAITTEYNILYNGDLALDLGRNQIEETYKDNYWQILPVERMQVSREINLPGAQGNENFKVAEEKAAKAIQKHSMLIQGKERNPQIDEAYLLLGKARYYDQRFIPALEAFNYILYRYPASNTIAHAQIWREKTNLRLENEELVIKNLKRLIKAGTMGSQDHADAHSILAQAYINRGELDSAVVPIRIAAEHTKNREEEGRYRYIQGQLYNYLDKRDSATYAFEQVIDLNRNIPREYLVNARLEKARNFNFNQEDPTQLLSFLLEMEEDRENRPYLDKIHFQIAEYYNHLDSTTLATEYYNKSLRHPSNDIFLRSVNYETLGNIYFDQSLYRTAGAYYDSTLTTIPKTSRDYFVIKRKRDNLEELILYEEIAEKNDSILRLVSMPETERLDYFTGYTTQLKTQAIARARENIIDEGTAAGPLRISPGAPPGLGGPGAPPGTPTPANLFYFYNPNRVAGGMAEFLRIWGPRELKDNWRTDAGSAAAMREDGIDEISELLIANNPRFDPRTYLDMIPGDPAIIDSITSQRDNAYFRLGLIYREKFRENQIALDRLNDLLEFSSEESLIIPANYYLYQINLEQGNTAEAERLKQNILRNYPDSRFAASINNPGQAIALENSANDIYLQLFDLFEKQEFVKLLEEGAYYMQRFRDEELLPKIELLMAMATGRIHGFNAYKKALTNVAYNYPQSEEGRKAQQLLNTALPQLENSGFKMDSTASNVKLLYSFAVMQKEEITSLKNKIDKALLDSGNKQYSTSVDVYDHETVFLMVHGLENIGRAQGLAEMFLINKAYEITREPVLISSENYRVVQIHKNLGPYIESSNNPKPQ